MYFDVTCHVFYTLGKFFFFFLWLLFHMVEDLPPLVHSVRLPFLLPVACIEGSLVDKRVVR